MWCCVSVLTEMVALGGAAVSSWDVRGLSCSELRMARFNENKGRRSPSASEPPHFLRNGFLKQGAEMKSELLQNCFRIAPVRVEVLRDRVNRKSVLVASLATKTNCTLQSACCPWLLWVAKRNAERESE